MEYLEGKIDQLEANSKNMNINRHVQEAKMCLWVWDKNPQSTDQITAEFIPARGGMLVLRYKLFNYIWTKEELSQQRKDSGVPLCKKWTMVIINAYQCYKLQIPPTLFYQD